MSVVFLENIDFSNTSVTTLFTSTSFTSLPTYLPIPTPKPKIRYRISFSGDSTSLLSNIIPLWRLVASTSQINTYADPGNIVREGDVYMFNLGNIYPPYTFFYFVDQGNNRIVATKDLLGTNWITFGSVGSGVNQFSSPSSVAVDPSGRIYIADTGNNRIVRIDNLLGSNWTTFGSLGSGVNQFKGVSGVFVDSVGKIYTSDNVNDRIIRIDDMTGTNWTAISTIASLAVSNPGQIFVDSSYKIYVADGGNSRVTRMDDMTGTNGVAYTSADWRNVQGIYLDGNKKIYICSTNAGLGRDLVARMDDMTGTNYVQLKASGSGTAQFKNPTNLYVDTSNVIYVTDPGNNRVISMTDMIGSGWVSFGTLGSGTNQLSGPWGIV